MTAKFTLCSVNLVRAETFSCSLQNCSHQSVRPWRPNRGGLQQFMWLTPSTLCRARLPCSLLQSTHWSTPMVKTWRPVFKTPITSPFLMFPIFQRVSVQIWFHALQQQSWLAAAVKDSGMRERLYERSKPSYTHLIETNWPLWAARRMWLRPGFGYLCLQKKQLKAGF